MGPFVGSTIQSSFVNKINACRRTIVIGIKFLFVLEKRRDGLPKFCDIRDIQKSLCRSENFREIEHSCWRH